MTATTPHRCEKACMVCIAYYRHSHKAGASKRGCAICRAFNAHPACGP